MSKALKHQSLKDKELKKPLLRKLVWPGKGGAKIVFKCMVPKLKAYSSKKYKKFHGIASQKLSCIDQKYEKWKPNEKFSIKCKHLGGGIKYVHFY